MSPITGGVSLAKRNVHRNNWYMAPVYFIGGMVAGPFVAFYNGVNHDAGIFKDFQGYWTTFELVFRPFDMILTK